MYYDRKNVEPEYALTIFTDNPAVTVSGHEGSISAEFQMAFENSGRKPIVIVHSTMTIDAVPESDIPNDITLTLSHYYEYGIQSRASFLSNRFLTISSNHVVPLMVSYQGKVDEQQFRAIRDRRSLAFSIIARDSHGNEYRSQKFVSGRP
jgi:hypothetical protein